MCPLSPCLLYTSQRDVGKRGLRSPAAGRIDAEDEALDAVLDLVVAELVRAHKGRKVGIEAGERLRPCPLVLHDAQEVDHLVAQGRPVSYTHLSCVANP